MLSELIGWELATVVYAVLFLLLFRRRLYYLGFCALVAIGGGFMALEWVPFLWLPVELIWHVADILTSWRKKGRI